jgi:predicted RNA methylase
LAGVTQDTSVYEPSAGHGALLLGSAPSKVKVNELNPQRAEDLRSQGYTVTEQDATNYVPEETFDVVIMNPPFGCVPQRSRLVDAGLSLFAVRQIYPSVLSRSSFHKSNMIPIEK